MEKDKTEVGITGKPVPKPRTPKQQYELEKNRRKRKHLGQNVGGTQYSSDVNPYFNPRSVREEVLVDYLLGEGFASDEKSAQAIAGAMSEEWVQSIIDEEVRGAKKGTIRSVIEKGGKSIKYVQSGGDIVAGDRAAAERASTADRIRSGRNRANAARAEQARKKSIQNLNAKSGEDSGDYDSGHHGDDDTSDGKRHYSLSHTNRDARTRRASGR